jgi:hypothetical protein
MILRSAACPAPAATKIPPRRTWWTFIAIVPVNYMLVSWLWRADDALMVPYTAFKAEAAKGNVESIYKPGRWHRRPLPDAGDMAAGPGPPRRQARQQPAP